MTAQTPRLRSNTAQTAARDDESVTAGGTAPFTPVVLPGGAGNNRTVTRAMLVRLQTLEEGTREYQDVRNDIVERNLSLVRYAARRFVSRHNDQLEDILQVGTIGLIKAVDRFDPDRGVEFTSFALPTILGEIKRFFRDTGWAVHVPRRLQEARLNLAKVTEVLVKRLDRAPTTEELAAELKCSRDEVVEALAVSDNAYTASSLDATDATATDGSLAENFGFLDPGMERVEELACLRPLITNLTPRDRTIISLRFGAEMTQSEIAAKIGVSQMQVSRLLTRILTQLRQGLLATA